MQMSKGVHFGTATGLFRNECLCFFAFIRIRERKESI